MIEHAKVIELRIRNVGPIEALDITPQSTVVEIRGRNATGKSTALNALSYLLEGKKALPDVPIRQGATKGEIVGVIGENRDTAMVFRRILRKKSTELIVTHPDGTPVASPQSVADALIGHRTVRAQAFCELPAAEQKCVLAEVAGIDLDALHARYDKAYADRTIVNRDVDRLRKAVGEIPVDESAGTELRDVLALSAELKAAHQKGRENDRQRARAKELDSQLDSASQLVGRQKARLAETQEDTANHIHSLQRQIEELKSRIETAENKQKALDEQYQNDIAASEHERDTVAESAERQHHIVDSLVDPDTSSIEQRIAEADRFNERVRAQQRRSSLITECQHAEQQSAALTAELTAAKDDMAKIIREAPMPIDGLAYTTDGVMFNGLPFAQASTSEQLAVSVAIGCARSPKLRAMTFDDGQALDEGHRARLYRMVHDAGMFVMIAIVDDVGGNGGVRIVEGTRDIEQQETAT